jgi:hypothetical protein
VVWGEMQTIEEAEAEIKRLREWQYNAVRYIKSSMIIGKRSCRAGDGLDYGWGERLIQEAGADKQMGGG